MDVDKALAAVERAHEALHQYYTLATGLQRQLNLPFLPSPMDKAITGLHEINTAISALKAMQKVV